MCFGFHCFIFEICTLKSGGGIVVKKVRGTAEEAQKNEVLSLSIFFLDVSGPEELCIVFAATLRFPLEL